MHTTVPYGITRLARYRVSWGAHVTFVGFGEFSADCFGFPALVKG